MIGCVLLYYRLKSSSHSFVIQNEAFVFYSNFTEEQLEPGFEYLIETIAAPGFNDTHTYRKYASKRFLKSSIFARQWTKTRWQSVAPETTASGRREDGMALDH